MRADVKHRTQFKHKLPIERVLTNNASGKKTSGSVAHDFEPIIIEEVYLNIDTEDLMAS